MDLLFRHSQSKKDRKSPSLSHCELKLYGDKDYIILDNNFDLDYHRYGTRKHVTFIHQITIYLNTGDVSVTYKILNDNLTDDTIFKTSHKIKKNDFKLLNDSLENGFYRGEKRLNYWGVKYERAINEIILNITNILKSKFNSDYYLNKSYKEKPLINELFDLIVDFHLYKKNIKGHDNVYFDIMDIYPTKKSLKLNDYKFLPSVLTDLNIKSKFLIKELNVSPEPVNLKSLNFLCKLFGNNYIDYIKKVDWRYHCLDTNVSKLKADELKDEHEKNSMIKLINNWNKTMTNSDNIFYAINKLLRLRESVEKCGMNIKIGVKNDNEYNNLIERLTNFKQYYQRGYKLKYTHDENFLNDIQQDIVIDNEIFKIKILSTEEDFIHEGYMMKNCMSKQFTNGLLYVYVSGSIKNKRINLQYRKGQLVQSYGKSNTPTPKIFLPFIEILNNRFKNYKDQKWTKDKYCYVTN